MPGKTGVRIIPGLITTNACSQALSGNQSCIMSPYWSLQPALHMGQCSVCEVSTCTEALVTISWVQRG